MLSPGLNLVMTVIGFAVSTMFIVFVCTRLICARIHLRSSRVSLPVAADGSDLGIVGSYAEKLHEREQQILELERKLEEKDRELRSMKIDTEAIERGIHGLEPVIVTSFPTKKFSDHFLSSGRDTLCTVCLAEYQEKDVLRVLPFCGHTFHVTCIDIWLKQHSTCPVCRISLRDSPDNKRALQPIYCPAIGSFSQQETFISDPCQDLFALADSSPGVENQITVSSQEDQFA